MAAPVLEASQVRKLKPEIRFEFGDWSISGITAPVYNGSFRENIQSFLGEFGQTKKYSIAAKPIWYLQIRGPKGIMLPLYIIEEIVEKSRNPYCDHCKFTGWGHHFVSKTRYHIILPEYNEWHADLMYDCFGRHHVFYGLIHGNGYGHLICINGVNENSVFFSDYDAMNLWDWICSMLRPRAISVRDVVDVKLLHVLAFGKSWYGKWGYVFRDEIYEGAVSYLRSYSLARIESDLRNTDSGRKLKRVFDKYRKVGDIPIATISDLLQFMLAFEARARMDFDSLVTSLAKSRRWPARTIKGVLDVILNLLKQNTAENRGKGAVSMQELMDEARIYSSNYEMIEAVLKSIRFLKMEGRMIRCSTNSSTERLEYEILDEVFQEAEYGVFPYYGMKFDFRWPEERIRHAAGVIVKSLNDGNRNAQSWEELYGKATKSIDDLKLIAFVLNSMDRAMFGNQIVSRTQNLATERTQFSVQDIVNKHDNIGILEAAENVDEDVLYFYTTLFSAYDDTRSVSLAIDDLLESSNHCVKEWPHNQDSNQLLAFSLHVVPRLYVLQKELARPLSPGEVVHVPSHTTKREMKKVVQSALRKTYCAMENITVEQIGGFENLANNKPISSILLPVYTNVPVEESGLNFETELLYEDGKRLVECDMCQAVHTTSCIGYKTAEYRFLCTKCKSYPPTDGK